MSKHVHLTKEDIEEVIASNDIVKMQEFKERVSSCVFCKRIWMKTLVEKKVWGRRKDLGEWILDGSWISNWVGGES